METDWDPEKRQLNLAKHGLDFIDARAVFEGATISFEDRRFDYGEPRYLTMGLLGGEVVVIAFTEPAEDRLRILSMRKATRNERALYYRKIAD